jgi:hypothetical protein
MGIAVGSGGTAGRPAVPPSLNRAHYSSEVGSSIPLFTAM